MPRGDEAALFSGYWLDAETGYMLSRMRWYDPEAGRWITRDPAGYVDGLSLYLYVKSNPLGLWDPTGLRGEPGVLEGVFNWFSSLAGLGSSADEPAQEPHEKMAEARPGITEVQHKVEETVNTMTEGAHVALDAGSIVTAPIGADAIFDGANAALYAAQGRNDEAGMAAAGVLVPFAADKLVKYAGKAASIIKGAVQNVMEGAAKTVDDAGGVTGKMATTTESAPAPSASSSVPRPNSTSESPARFFTHPDGTTIDIKATPPGRWIQPDRSATDILQRELHGNPTSSLSITHTHPAIVNVNSATGRGSTKLSDNVRPVSAEDVENIVRGAATRSKPKGRQQCPTCPQTILQTQN
jgi:RHS repeat-associated protein